MAAEVFVDTSAWYPIAVEDHPDHGWLSDALASAIGGGRRVVTTNLIVAETYALLAARTGPSSALDFVRAVRKPPNEVVSSTPELEDSATRWLGRQWPGYSHPDWVISFTDAVSFEVISERGIREVLTLKQDGWFLGVAVAGEVGGGGQVWRPRGGEPAPHMPGR